MAAPRLLAIIPLVCSLVAVAQAQRPDRVVRDAALRRAQVRLQPPVPIAEASFAANPASRGSFAADQTVSCRFHPIPASGTSRKFDCALPGGEIIRVKYGASNPEVYAEVAASRLLSALGYATDLISVVKAVRCFGCPADPFPLLQSCWRDGEVDVPCLGRLDFDTATEFTPVIVERRFPGEKIEARRVEGWEWRELDTIDERDGGAPRREVDAFRLMAVFLAHWDNKPENQRLVCLAVPPPVEGGRCERVLAMIADLGATFGPPKVSLAGWAGAPIWVDVERCSVSMRTMPYGGSSFDDTVISEEGRALLAGLLNQLSSSQIRQLFSEARFDRPDEWARVFEQRRRAISDRSPCPT